MGAILRTGPAVPLQILSVSRTPDGHFLIDGNAAPLARVSIEATGDISQPFATIGSAICDVNGVFRYHDASAKNLPMRLYRAVSQ